jgi:hypothetical protein
MPRLFSKSKRKTKQQVLEWANEQMKLGIPRQLVCYHLLDVDRSKMSIEEMQAHSNAESELSSVMLDRNLRGMTFEKSDNVGKAIEMYEQNIADNFFGSHPYERLRIIYTRDKEFSNAIRVCQSYLDLPYAGKMKKAKFREHLGKLKSKLKSGKGS